MWRIKRILLQLKAGLLKPNASTILWWAIIIAMVVDITLLQRFMSRLYHPVLDLVWKRHMIVGAACDAVLLLAPFFLLKPARRGWALVPLWLLSAWCFVQALYDISYNDMMPLRSFTYVGNVGSVLWDSAMGNIEARPASLWMLALPTAVTIAHFVWLRPRLQRMEARRRPWLALASVGVFAVWYVAMPLLSIAVHGNDEDTAWETPRSHRYKFSLYNRGVILTMVADAWRLFPHRLSKSDLEEIDAFFSHDAERFDSSPLAGVNDGKNLVILLVESLNAWAVDLDIDGRPVAPTLRSLARPDSALCSRAMIMQACDGRSSDGLFTYMTGLLPLRHGSVAMDYPHGNYPSLARTLKARGYYTGEISYDIPGMWNVETMTKEYGLDTLIYYPQLRPRFEGSDKLSDKTIFAEAAAQSSQWKQPFFMVVFNFSTHSPYDKFNEPTWISQSRAYTPAVRCYLEKLHYFDLQLGQFLEKMKRDGTYDNTVFLIVSDHTDLVDEAPQGRPSLSPAGNDCLFVLVNGGVTGRVDGFMGQIDVYPTLLDVMNLRDSSWQGLGHSVLRSSGTAIAPDGKVYGTTSQSGRVDAQQRAWDISELLITGHYFTRQSGEK